MERKGLPAAVGPVSSRRSKKNLRPQKAPEQPNPTREVMPHRAISPLRGPARMGILSQTP